MPTIRERLAQIRDALTDKWYAVPTVLALSAALFVVLREVGGVYSLVDKTGINLHMLLGMRFLNILLFGAIIYLTYRFGGYLFDDERIALGAALLLIPTQLGNHAIIAWTHVPTTFFILLSYYAYVRFLDDGQQRWLTVLAFAGTMTFTIKYADAVMLLPILVHGGHHLVMRQEYFAPRRFLVPVLVAGIVLAPTLAFHKLAFGSVFTSPYQMRPHALPPNEKQNLATAFDPLRSIVTVPAMLVRFDPYLPMLRQDIQDFNYRFYKDALLQSSPFLVLAYFGMLLAWRRRTRIRDLKLFVSGMALLVFTYGSWVFFSGGWTTNMRYLTPIIPFLSIYSAYAIAQVDIARRDLIQYGIPAFLLSTAVLTGIVLGKGDLAAVSFMNTVGLGAMILTGAAYYLVQKDAMHTREAVFTGLLAASIGTGIVMVYVMDNWMLFYGAKSSIFLLNSDMNVFLRAIFAAGIGTFLYLTGKSLIQFIRPLYESRATGIPI